MKNARKVAGVLLFALLMVAAATLLIAASSVSPSDAWQVFFKGMFGNKNSIGEIFVKATPLILTGLACALAFRTGFFNIGAEGQFYMGATAAAAVALRCTFLSPVFRIIAAFAAGFAAGGIWALIAAGLKLRFRISEIIVTIMLSYIAVNFVGVAVRTWLQSAATAMPQSDKLDAAVVLPRLIKGTRLHLGFPIALLLTTVVWFILEKTTWGYEMRVVGYNARAAQCTGISVGSGIVRASVLSGGLAGIAGVIEFMAIQKKLLEGFSDSCGYTGVLIALLAANKPQFVPFVAILYAAADVGAASMQRQTGVPAAMVDMLIGAVVIGVLLRSWIAHSKRRKERASRVR